MDNLEQNKLKYLTRSFLFNKKQPFRYIQGKSNYYFIIGSHNFLLKEEPLEEVLRERFQYCLREKKLMNFWLLESPNYVHSPILKLLQSKLPKQAVVILSTNKPFICWLKLRYHHVGIGFFISPSKSILNPLAITKV